MKMIVKSYLSTTLQTVEDVKLIPRVGEWIATKETGCYRIVASVCYNFGKDIVIVKTE